MKVFGSVLLGYDVGYYLSLVILFVQERVISGELDHLEGMFSGFMNDGQVEQPVGRGKNIC